MAWTEDRVATLTKLWADGLSASQVAQKLGGVTRNAVIGKVSRLGLSGRARPSRPKAESRKRKQPSKPRAKTIAKRAAVREKAKALSVQPEPKRRHLPSQDIKPAERRDGKPFGTMDLTNHTCKFPIGTPGESGFRFCGRKSDPDEPYCTAHSMVAYKPSRRKLSDGSYSYGQQPTARIRGKRRPALEAT